MRVSLHLGVHRTATGAMLSWLDAAEAPLSGAGVSIWGPRDFRAGLLPARAGRSGARAAKGLGAARTVGRLRLRQARAEAAGLSRLLMVAPDLIGPAERCLADASPYADAGARLAEVAPSLLPRLDRVSISIRRPDAYWASLLAGSVMRGGPLPTASFGDLLVTQPRRWRQVVAEVAEALPGSKLVVWPFEAFADLPERRLEMMIGSLPHGMPSARAIRTDKAPSARTLASICADRGTPASIRSTAGGRWQPFDSEQIAAFAAQYAEDLAWLRAGADGLATFIDTPTRPGNAKSGSDRRIVAS